MCRRSTHYAAMRKSTQHGIYYGWVVVAAVSGMNFANGATAIGVLTVFILPFSTEFGWTRTQISAVTSVGAILGALMAPYAGRLTDQRGARLPLTLGAACIVLAMLNLAAMQSLLWFYLAFGLARLADQGCIQASSPPAVAKWFRRYQGRAQALLALSSAVGGAVLPLLVDLVMRVWHWRLAWLLLGGIVLLLGLLPCALVVKRQPEDLGLPVDGVAVPAHQARPEASSYGEQRTSWRLKAALQTPTLWCLLVTAFAMGVSSTGVALHLVPYLQQQGLTQTVAVQTVSLGSLASGLSYLAWGMVADRLPTRPLLVGSYALKTVSLIVLLQTQTVAAAYCFTVLQGIAEGGLRTLMTVLLARYYGRQHLGAIYGVLRAVQVAGFALGPLVSGVTFDLFQHYHGAFLAFVVLSLVGTLLIGLTRPPRTP